MIIIIARVLQSYSLTLTGIHEKRKPRVVQRVTARTVSDKEYYHRESTQIAQALVENQARVEGYSINTLVLVPQTIFTGN